MILSASGLVISLFRATVFLALSAALVRGLIRLLGCSSARTQRLAWFLVLVQGIVLIRLPLCIPWYDAPPAPPVAHEVQRGLPRDATSAAPGKGPVVAEVSPAATELQPAAAAGTMPRSVPVSVPWWKLVNWWPIAALAWAAGILFIVSHGLYRYLRFLRRLRVVEQPDEGWSAAWNHLLRSRGVRRPIPLRVLRDVGPALCLLPSGYQLVVPAGIAARLSSQQREAILSHELAHYEHGDPWKLVLVRLLALPHWFNPLAWWAVRNFDECTEWLCDRVASGGEATTLDYAHALLELGSLRLLPLSYTGAAGGGRLFNRIRRLACGPFPEDSKLKTAVFLAVALGLVLVGAIRVELVAKAAAPEAPTAAASANGKTEAATKPAPAPRRSSPSAPAAPNEAPPPLLTAFGKVVDPAAKPVAGATVYLREWSSFRSSVDPYNQDPNDILATTRTDAEGAFRFDGVPAKPLHEEWLRDIPWDVVAVAKPYAIGWRHLDAAQRSKPLVIALQPAATISGRVTDRRGRPIPDAELRLSGIYPLMSDFHPPFTDPRTLDLQRSRLSHPAKTDADGNVTITGLPRDVQLIVNVARDGFRSQRIRVATTNQPQPDIEEPQYANGKWTELPTKVYAEKFSAILGPPSPRLVGRVIAADTKEPLARLRLAAIWDSHEICATTDQDGRFAFKETFRPKYRLLVFSPVGSAKYLGRLVMVDLPQDKKEVSVDVELPRGEILSGAVLDQGTGHGVAGVTVAFDGGFDANTTTVDGPLPGITKTDQQGHFQLVVPPGRGIVRIMGPLRGYPLPRPIYRRPGEVHDEDNDFSRKVDVLAGKPTGEVKFAVRHRAAEEEESPSQVPPVARPDRNTVEGVVTNPDGKPAAGVEVGPSLWFQNIEDEGTPVRTDRAGHFSFRLTPRTISDEIIMALDKKHSLRGHARMPDASRKETPATPVKIGLHSTGVITGRVLEGDKPISHAGVQLDELEPVKGSRDGSLIALNRYGATTDADGRFTFPFVEAGRRLNLSVYSQGYAETDQRSGTVEVAAGQTWEVPPFSLIRMDKFVAGIVVDPEGKPVAGVVVGARMRSGQSFPRGFTREPTGSDGRFTIRGVPNVPLTLDAYIRPADNARDRSIRFSSRVEAEPGQADVRIVLDLKLARRKK